MTPLISDILFVFFESRAGYKPALLCNMSSMFENLFDFH